MKIKLIVMLVWTRRRIIAMIDDQTRKQLYLHGAMMSRWWQAVHFFLMKMIKWDSDRGQTLERPELFDWSFQNSVFDNDLMTSSAGVTDFKAVKDNSRSDGTFDATFDPSLYFLIAGGAFAATLTMAGICVAVTFSRKVGTDVKMERVGN